MLRPDDIAFIPPCSNWRDEEHYIESKQKLCDKLNKGEPLCPVTEAPWVFYVPEGKSDRWVSTKSAKRDSQVKTIKMAHMTITIGLTEDNPHYGHPEYGKCTFIKS